MRLTRRPLQQHAMLALAVLRGFGEFVALQSWRLRERRTRID